MPPFLPVAIVTRSQSVRFGIGPGIRTSGELGQAVAGVTPLPVYVDVGDGASRRDLQRHATLGSYVVVGGLTFNSAPYFFTAQPTVALGTGMAVTVTVGTLRARLYGGTAVVGANPTPIADRTVAAVGAPGLPLAAASTPLDRTDLVIASFNNATGLYVYSILTGIPAAAGTSVAPTVTSGQIPVASVLVPTGSAVPTTITNAAPLS